MITTRPHILIKVTFLKHFALEVWVSIFRWPFSVSIATSNIKLIPEYYNPLIAQINQSEETGENQIPFFW